ncbi:MAG: endonuclease/exonuclease/phosphatase family protein [Anaerolineales bacterium]|nr:endonuclease/exonuclease/phosphatase family protein [Anaerolineales bacterium]
MKIITFNLRHHANRWEERLPLVIAELLRENADVIAFQEVSLNLGPDNQAQIIADRLNTLLTTSPYQVFFAEGKGYLKGKEGIALLSRHPIQRAERIKLPKKWRVAQRILIDLDGREIEIVNTHLHHLPLDDEKIRHPQAEALLAWVQDRPVPTVIVGDFNAQPGSSTIEMLKTNYRSAFEAVHGNEPDFTWPTPLVAGTDGDGAPEMIDYIFFKPDQLTATDCYLIGTQPPATDPTLYPSDHFGVAATFDFH